MARIKGPKRIHGYGAEFKLKAVKLRQTECAHLPSGEPRARPLAFPSILRVGRRRRLLAA